MSNLITGLFETHTEAENAVTQLKQRGYTANEISVIAKHSPDEGKPEMERVFSDTTGTHHVPLEHVKKVPTAVDAGSVGALIGGLLAVTTIIIPGIGLLTAGALAAMFVGGGALAGSALGWLIDQGIPADIAPYYERGLQEGGVIVAVAAHPGDEADIYAILHGGAVAYAGVGKEAYIAPSLASRHADLTPPASKIEKFF